MGEFAVFLCCKLNINAMYVRRKRRFPLVSEFFSKTISVALPTLRVKPRNVLPLCLNHDSRKTFTPCQCVWRHLVTL